MMVIDDDGAPTYLRRMASISTTMASRVTKQIKGCGHEEWHRSLRRWLRGRNVDLENDHKQGGGVEALGD
ncbi:unnamed protein product [Linum trigynum]|uniref:Uncharacterized protein n=1 Tax=Linum trigynum TaxID=586398 RepID=A0AAV2FPX4_9ROSI